MNKQAFFERWQKRPPHVRLQSGERVRIPEPERHQYMRAVWRMWSNPPHPTGIGAYTLLERRG